ncbi:MAG: type II secretion system protein [Minisyncoccia bacterium]|jgi:prepilin-type N-terminal cleavage/methylation domain-containing protein
MKKGFTLIELLIVIAIIAVLSVVVILSLNPAELLRQARDSNRISDMATLKSAIALYLTDVSNPNLGSAAYCYISNSTATVAIVASSTGSWTAPAATPGCGYWFPSNTTNTWMNATTTRSIGTVGSTTGNGWIPVNLANISSGSPLGQEPIDPTNQGGVAACTGTVTSGVSLSNCSLFYSYIVSGTSFKLAAFMESRKYSAGGAGDVPSKDGGYNPYVYEQGLNLSL